MKRFIFIALLMAIALGLHAQDMLVEIRQMTGTSDLNQRWPAVAENVKGERLYTFRGGDRRSHYYYYKNGTWSGGGQVPGSPAFNEYWYSAIVADSTGTFHYVCEEGSRALYYAYFTDGSWAPMRQIDVRHEATLALGVRSDDTVVLVSALVSASGGGLTKDVVLGTKTKKQNMFTDFVNITADPEAETMVDLAIDAEDNSWISYKCEFPGAGKEILDTILHGLDTSSKDIYWKNVSDQTGWTWYSKVAVNGDGKIMVTWMKSEERAYFSCLFDPSTDQWTETQRISDGPTRPWCSMYNTLLARESDFYWVGLTGDRMVVLYKYDEKQDSWSKLADVSNRAANWCSASMGNESLLISWDSFIEPTSCYLTTVSGVLPPPPIKVQSVSNLVVEKKLEQSFFHGNYLNILTWEANPLNAEQGITITAQRVYRKVRTADSSQWLQIIELGPNVYTFTDKNVASDSDYVYAVTCVDSEGNESPVSPDEETSDTTHVPRP